MEDLGIVFDLTVDHHFEVEKRDTVEYQVLAVDIELMEVTSMGGNLQCGSSNEENLILHDEVMTEEQSSSSSPQPHAEGVSDEAGDCKDSILVNLEGDLDSDHAGVEIKQQVLPLENHHRCFLKRHKRKILRPRRLSWNQYCSGANIPGNGAALRRGILWKKNLHVQM